MRAGDSQHSSQERDPMPFISVVTACYNEEENVREVYERVREVVESLPGYTYEHVFIDNASKDRTVEILREIAGSDKRVKVIVNTRNFGHIRSPFHGLLQASGEAVISIVADLQDPPDMIRDFVSLWEQGNKVVMAVKTQSEESRIMFAVRRSYYRLLRRLSDVDLAEQFTGFGLYDRQVMDALRGLNEPYPYFRGLIAELGFAGTKVEYLQPKRKRGFTKNNLYTLYDMAMLGMTSYSKIPLRMATFLGFGMAALSGLAGLFYLVYKLVYWNRFELGLAPLVVGLFFFASVQLFFLGILGEYVASVHTYVQRRPLVIERERINF